MMALSIRQPWAWLIVKGLKPVENRTWRSPYRGELLIHAGRVFDEEGLESICEQFPFSTTCKLPASYELGGIVGVAHMVGCVTDHPSAWFNGPFGFVMRDARPLPFRPWPGKLGIFSVPDLAEIEAGLHTASAAQCERAGQERLF
jgi:hypothetical protein